MFIPVYLVFVNSLKTKAEASSMGVGLADDAQWSNFAIVIETGKLLTAFGNSMLYAVGATLIGTTLAAMAAYVLSRNRTRFNRWDLLLHHHGHRDAYQLCHADQGDAGDATDQHADRHHPALRRHRKSPSASS